MGAARRPLLWAVVVVGAGAGKSCQEDPNFVPPHAQETEQHWVETGEGYHVFMERYASEGPPVVLCHGISSNHHFWNLTPDRSLALDLHEKGFDVWNMDLRGHGRARNHPDGRRQKVGWTVDDYGKQDLPAAFAHVREVTGADKLHYVGHSMGGMVLAIYLATEPNPTLVSAVTVGSPLDFRDPDMLFRLALTNSWAGQATPFIPTPTGARLAGRLRRAPFNIDDMLFNPEHIEPETRRIMYERIVSPMSRGEIRQFGTMFKSDDREGEFQSADGAVVYREQLAEVTVPMRFLSGRADRIAAPDRVWTYYDSVGSPEKDFIVLGRANGFSHDYGHLDMGVGDEASEEVFPLISDWLEAHP